MLKSWVNTSATQSIDKDTLEDLRQWHSILSSFNPLRMIPSAEPTDVGKWAQSRWAGSGKGPSDKGIIAWLETVAIRLGILMMIEMRAVLDKCFIVSTDNTTMEGAIRNRKSRDLRVNGEWKRIQELLINADIDIEGRRVSSALNISDALSRGVISDKHLLEKVKVTMPADLAGLFVQT
ncbi:hypothetical protein PCANC_26705 [Puccinia coronata f. sp. avenae]|uniref:Uncharacterized protein n=1 Tax=Puccinia coronata f. sp. avenae TaxID=200324 RepID=A0A2N5TCX7_9BASI|nr:hypothetical protein PCANC_26705 [Puccinia coronata f. sp. avenae]